MAHSPINPFAPRQARASSPISKYFLVVFLAFFCLSFACIGCTVVIMMNAQRDEPRNDGTIREPLKAYTFKPPGGDWHLSRRWHEDLQTHAYRQDFEAFSGMFEVDGGVPSVSERDVRLLYDAMRVAIAHDWPKIASPPVRYKGYGIKKDGSGFYAFDQVLRRAEHDLLVVARIQLGGRRVDRETLALEAHGIEFILTDKRSSRNEYHRTGWPEVEPPPKGDLSERGIIEALKRVNSKESCLRHYEPYARKLKAAPPSSSPDEPSSEAFFELFCDTLARGVSGDEMTYVESKDSEPTKELRPKQLIAAVRDWTFGTTLMHTATLVLSGEDGLQQDFKFAHTVSWEGGPGAKPKRDIVLYGAEIQSRGAGASHGARSSTEVDLREVLHQRGLSL